MRKNKAFRREIFFNMDKVFTYIPYLQPLQSPTPQPYQDGTTHIGQQHVQHLQSRFSRLTYHTERWVRKSISANFKPNVNETQHTFDVHSYSYKNNIGFWTKMCLPHIPVRGDINLYIVNNSLYIFA